MENALTLFIPRFLFVMVGLEKYGHKNGVKRDLGYRQIVVFRRNATSLLITGTGPRVVTQAHIWHDIIHANPIMVSYLECYGYGCYMCNMRHDKQILEHNCRRDIIHEMK